MQSKPQPKERQSLDSPRFLSQLYHARNSKDGTFIENFRASMLKRGYHDILADSLQLRRRGYSAPKQFIPLQIRIPPTSTLCDLDGLFENPRPAPLPQGLRYNTAQHPPIPVVQTPSEALSTIPFGTRPAPNTILLRLLTWRRV